MFGLIGAVVGKAVSGWIDNRKAKKARANAVTDNRLSLSRLVESAKLAGFHPLEALRAQGGGSFGNLPTGVAPLASSEVIRNAVQGVAEHLTSDKTNGKAQSKATGEINDVINDEKAAGGGLVIENRTADAAKRGTVQGTGSGPALSRLPTSVETDPWGKLPEPLRDTPESWVDDQNLQVDYRNDNGQVVRVPLGPDIDEWISGKFLEYQADRQMVRQLRPPQIETEELESYETSQTNRLRRLSEERDRALRIQSQRAAENARKYRNQAP